MQAKKNSPRRPRLALFLGPRLGLAGADRLVAGHVVLDHGDRSHSVGLGVELRGRERVSLGADVDEARGAQLRRERARQRRMREVVIPRPQHALHAIRARGSATRPSSSRRPEDERPSARAAAHGAARAARRAMSGTYSSTCTQSARSKLAVLDRQRGHVRLGEADVRRGPRSAWRRPRASAGWRRRPRRSRPARPGRAARRRRSPGPQPASRIRSPGPGAERLADQRAPPKDVARPIHGLELLDEALVEDQPAHGLTRGRAYTAAASRCVRSS